MWSPTQRRMLALAIALDDDGGRKPGLKTRISTERGEVERRLPRLPGHK